VSGFAWRDVLTPELIRAVLDRYRMPLGGLHGPAHWARVLENGLRLARSTGADPVVVALFALFHDSRRRNEGVDPGHGTRGARFARRLWGVHLHLDRTRFDLLDEACRYHTDGDTEGEVTVRTCWDADRLDLPRVGFAVDPARLCTGAARDPAVIAWATERARHRYRTPFLDEWT
jgi:uncharacterized protein